MSGTSSADDTIKTILSTFGDDNSVVVNAIPKDQVIEWMRSSSLQIRGCLYAMIADIDRAKHVSPALGFDDYFRFVIPYLEQCIEEDSTLEWVESRYLAGHALVAWIVSFWNDSMVSRDKVAEIKGRLAGLYKRGDEGIRDAVVNAVLEHLFEHRSLREYFSDWLSDPVLAGAYSDALLWSKDIEPDRHDL